VRLRRLPGLFQRLLRGITRGAFGRGLRLIHKNRIR
jgi:hypothetical protein